MSDSTFQSITSPENDTAPGTVLCPVCGYAIEVSTARESLGGYAQPAPVHRSVFRREGEYWFIGYEADLFRLKDTKGLSYLHNLLSNPGREILALHIVQHTEGGAPAVSTLPSLSSNDGLRLFRPGDADEFMDETARNAYERRIRDLSEEIESADLVGNAQMVSSLRQERDFIVAHLAAATGIGGTTRKGTSPAERARQSVTKAIKAALSRIAKHSQALERHLASTIRTGTYCIYQPDPRIPLTWQL